MQRILVVNVNWLGDVIFSLPVFHALKQSYPEAQLSCLAVPRVADILERSADIDQVIVYDEKGRDRFLWGKLRVLKRLRQEKFDAVFFLHRSWSRALLGYLAGIPRRVGYEAKGRGWMLTTRVAPLAGQHRMDEYLRVLEQSGIVIKERTYTLPIAGKAVGSVRALMHNAGLDHGQEYVVINPGGNWDLKRWPAKNFQQLVRQLQDRYPALRYVISGADKDQPLADVISQGLNPSPIVLTGQTDLDQLLALLAGARLVISADSGPLHLAASTGTKVLAIFGPTRPALTGPRGGDTAKVLQNDVGCNRGPCYFLECPRNVCMESVSVAQVFAAAVELLN